MAQFDLCIVEVMEMVSPETGRVTKHLLSIPTASHPNFDANIEATISLLEKEYGEDMVTIKKLNR